VIAREGFDIDSLQTDYRKVALWSAGGARTEYISGMQVTNPASPLSRLPRSAIVEVRVKSVSPLGGQSALVRFETQRRDGAERRGSARAWAAVIRYRFSTEPLSVEDRFVNPLGFQVTRYRRDPEALPPPEAEQVAPAIQTLLPGTVRGGVPSTTVVVPQGTVVVPGGAVRAVPRPQPTPEVEL
jgi:type IV secretion system protein VirB8